MMQGAGLYASPERGQGGKTPGWLGNPAASVANFVGKIWEVECTMVKLHGQSLPTFCAGGVNPFL